MVNIPSHELALQLPRLLAMLRLGEEINITEDGLLVARLLPVPSTTESSPPRRRRAAVAGSARHASSPSADSLDYLCLG